MCHPLQIKGSPRPGADQSNNDQTKIFFFIKAATVGFEAQAFMAGQLADHVFFEPIHYEILSALISRISAMRSAISGESLRLPRS